MSAQKYYLGIDGGGTKTEAVIIDENRKTIKKATALGSNAKVHGIKVATENIYEAVKSIVDENNLPQKAVFALAAVDTEANVKEWQQSIKDHKELSNLLPTPPKIVNDIVAALRSGTQKHNAIALISGTGSNCYGINQEGKEVRVGGRDYILSDEGSGYYIGLKILKTVTKDLDERGSKTLLTKLLLEDLKIDSLDDLDTEVYKKPWNKTDISKIAPLAETAAEKGDEVATGIIKKSAHELGLMVKTAATKLDLEDKPFTIVTTGSIFKIQKILNKHLEEDILNFNPKAQFAKQKIDSATAAAYLAQEG